MKRKNPGPKSTSPRARTSSKKATGAPRARKSALDKWQAVTANNPLVPPRVPLVTLLNEAQSVARFIGQRWEPTSGARGKPGLPGLKDAPQRFGLSPGVRGEIEELVAAIREVDAHYNERARSSGAFPYRRCHRVLVALQHQPEFAKALRGFGPSGRERSRAERREKLLKALDAVQKTLARRPALLPATGKLSRRRFDELYRVATKTGGTLELMDADLVTRDKLLSALHDRVGAVRTAARALFRDFPEEVRSVTSAYEREKRASHRKSLALARRKLGRRAAFEKVFVPRPRRRM